MRPALFILSQRIVKSIRIETRDSAAEDLGLVYETLVRRSAALQHEMQVK